MNIRTRNQPKIDPLRVYRRLQISDSLPDLRAIIIIDARHDVGSASLNRYTPCGSHSGHFKGDRDVWRAIVDARQDVAVKVNHSGASLPSERQNVIYAYSLDEQPCIRQGKEETMTRTE